MSKAKPGYPFPSMSTLPEIDWPNIWRLGLMLRPDSLCIRSRWERKSETPALTSTQTKSVINPPQISECHVVHLLHIWAHLIMLSASNISVSLSAPFKAFVPWNHHISQWIRSGPTSYPSIQLLNYMSCKTSDAQRAVRFHSKTSDARPTKPIVQIYLNTDTGQ